MKTENKLTTVIQKVLLSLTFLFWASGNESDLRLNVNFTTNGESTGTLKGCIDPYNLRTANVATSIPFKVLHYINSTNRYILQSKSSNYLDLENSYVQGL